MKSKPRASEPPACYASAFPGLEEVVADEIAHSLDGDIKRRENGIIVFRVPEVDNSLLRLRATEDVFLLAWGTDQLTYKAEDLDRIRRWTAKDADWPRLLQIHHAIRPKPKGKPTYRLVTQMTGEHAYRRFDARKALARGLEGKLPASWRHAEDNAAVEIWLTIHGATAVCGLRPPTQPCGIAPISASICPRRCGRRLPPRWSAWPARHRARSCSTRCAGPAPFSPSKRKSIG